jgi:hypothetical protein
MAANGTNGTQKKGRARQRSKPDWAPRLLAALRESANVQLSCAAAGVPRRTFYNRRDADPEFAAAVAEALEDGCDLLEAEARRRAVEGVPRPKFDRAGRPIIDPATGLQYVEREYSDTLLIVLLKAHRPEKFRENYRHEYASPDGGAVKPITFIEVVKTVERDPEPEDDAPADRAGDSA